MNAFARSTGIVLAVIALGAQAAPGYEGRWEGAIAGPGAPVALVLDLAPAPSGWIGSVVLPGFGVKGAPVGDIVANAESLRLTLPGALRAEGAGVPALTLRAEDPDVLVGEFQQAGLTAPLR